MAPSKGIDALAMLETTISNLKTLLQRFQTALQSPTPAHPPIEDTPNPLAVLSDAAQILKAQTTKLSLLLLNKPFTPSAITFILTSLSNSCLPALMSALELCPADKYTNLMHHYIKSSLSRIMMELLSLLSSIPQNEYGAEKTLGRDTLASTGVLWAECDKMVALGSGGVIQVAAQRVEEYHGLLKDAIAELEEWDPDEDSESDTDSLPSNKGNTFPPRPIDAPLEQSVQGLSLSSIAALRKQTLGTLRIIRVLYPALVKRRILTFPNINSTATAETLPSSVQIRSLDKLVDHTQQFTEETDEIAGALYAGDVEEVDDRLTKLAEGSKTCVEGVRLSWSGNKDEFTTWAEKWMMRLDEILIDADRPQRTISWQDYASAVKRIAVGLRAIGVAEQDCVALLSHNDIYYYVLGDGVIAAGATFAGIPTFVKQSELGSHIAAAQVEWLFVAVEFLDLALKTAQSLGINKSRVIVFDPPGLEPYAGPQPRFGEIMSADESLWQNPYHGKDPKVLTALRMFTSGTTGTVKAAEISHAAQLTRLGPQNNVSWPHDVRVLQTIGIYHISGQSTCNRAFAGKFRAYISSADDATTILDRIQSFGITMTLLPPRTMEDITAAIHAGIRSQETLQSLDTVVLAGSPSRKEAVEAFAALLPSHARLRAGYASTEAGLITMTLGDVPFIPGYVGSVAPGIELKIINPETLEKVSSDTEGEICVRSAEMLSKYCNNQAVTDSALLPDKDGSWFRTGDKGYLDPNNGQVAVTGRFKEIFKVKYEEVAPVDVEDELMKHPSIADAAVTSATARDNNMDCECVAYVVRGKDSQVTAQEVVDYIASRMAHHKAPTGGVVFCESIPRNSIGKIVRHQLIERQALPGSAKYVDISLVDGK